MSEWLQNTALGVLIAGVVFSGAALATMLWMAWVIIRVAVKEFERDE